MKINKTAVFALFGIMALGLAFWAIPANASHESNSYDSCDYYDSCGYDDSYDSCDSCDSNGGEIVVNNDIYVNSDNYNENNNEVNVNYGDDQNYDYPAPSGSCTGTVSNGDVVTWRAQGSGGNGYFSYRWTGTDGLSSFYPTIVKRYTTFGTKTANVEITSNNETITRTCTVVIEEEVQTSNLVASCVASPATADSGDTVRYTANVSGGEGTYTYSWTGTNSLTGSTRTVSKSYNTAGTKSATVSVTSGNQTKTATCNSTINEDEQNNDNLNGYCTGRPSNPEEDERVTWTAYPNGGDGDYDYDWSGTDSLDGNDKSISKRYDDKGTKRATVRITSDGKTITRTCDVDVDNKNNKHNNNDLEAYCKASPEKGEIGDRIKWTVYPNGGNSHYTYKWNGDENLDGSDKSITKTYKNSGRKEAEVRVKSDGDTVTVRCSANINKDVVTHNDDDGGIYLSSIPATGISPTMKISLFGMGMLLWSAFLAYLYIARRNEKMKEEEMLASLEK